jgi:GAF domain-containing protein
VLTVISRSTFDLQPVLETLIENATRLASSDGGVVYKFDGELQRLAAAYGISSELRDFIERNPRRPGRGSAVGRALLEGRPVHIHDVLADPDYTYPGAGFGEYRTILGVPMMREGVSVGVFAVWRAEVQPFTDKQIGLITTFADQAVIALENVRLFQELEARNRELTEALEQQTATGEILRVISRSPTEIQPVLDAVVENAIRLCDAYDAAIFRIDHDVFRLVAHRGPLAVPDGLVVPVIRGTAGGRSVLERRALQVTDLEAEVDEFPEGSRFARQFGHRTTLSVPLVREGLAIGVIQIRRAEVRLFTDKQIALLQTFAAQAAIAIENVRLFTELQEKNRALTEAHAQVTEALGQQTATSEILRVISSSPTDIRPIFDAIVESALRLCDGVYSAVYRVEGDMVHLVAHNHKSLESLRVLGRHWPKCRARRA